MVLPVLYFKVVLQMHDESVKRARALELTSNITRVRVCVNVCMLCVRARMWSAHPCVREACGVWWARA